MRQHSHSPNLQFKIKPIMKSKKDKKNFSKHKKRGSQSRERDIQPENLSSLPRAENNKIWLFGHHSVTAALQNPDRDIEGIALTAANKEKYTDLMTEHKVPMISTNRDELDKLFGEDTVHQGVGLLCEKLPEYALEDLLFSSEDNDVYLILDQVTDPHNVGAILRSAAVFGAKAVILTERNAPEESAVLAKSASGALETTPLVYVGNLARAIDKIREAGFWTVGFAGEAETELQNVTLTGKIALIMGAEGPGMRRLTRENCDTLARIPMAENGVGSLNVSNAAAVALFATTAQRHGKS